jgi:SNF2 family DNA or RNA helicase
MKAYKDMKDDMYIFIKNMNDDEIIAKAQTILIQLLRLSQLTNGFMTDKSLNGHPHWFGESKLKELDNIVDEVISNGDKIVLWSRWVPCVKALYERYKKYNSVYLSGDVKSEDRIEAINNFQEGNSKVFAGQMQSGGMGITLHAANVEVFLDKAFVSPSTIFQATERLYRIGQTKTVVVISLIAKGTVDEKWDVLIKEKQEMAEEVLRDNEIKMDKQHILEILK